APDSRDLADDFRVPLAASAQCERQSRQRVGLRETRGAAQFTPHRFVIPQMRITDVDVAFEVLRAQAQLDQAPPGQRQQRRHAAAERATLVVDVRREWRGHFQRVAGIAPDLQIHGVSQWNVFDDMGFEGRRGRVVWVHRASVSRRAPRDKTRVAYDRRMASHRSLRGTRIAITRPAGAGGAWASRVRALGGTPLLLPGSSLRAAPDAAAARKALRTALACDIVIFTSPAAVR